MENLQDLVKSVISGKNIDPVKKTWKSPYVTEIPKFVILSGVSPKLAEGPTDFPSF